MDACYVLMLGYNADVIAKWELGVCESAVIDKIIFDNKKPGRVHKCSIIIYSTEKWANSHINKLEK
jgi:hypothetical protein